VKLNRVVSCVVVCVGLAFAGVLGPRGEAQAQGPKASAWTIETLLAGFAAMPGLQAEFREEKHMALLAEPLVNEGTLHFASGKLARHVTKPVASSVLIADGLLEFGDGSGKETIDLDANPVVRLFVDSFVHIFAGDRVALEQLYSIQFSPADDGTWLMVLRPRMSPIDKVIDRVILEGEDLAVAKMRIIEIGGDETITAFSKVDTAKKYSARELAEVFRVR
jgi:Outer membrane lipoprotein carrier protein LolA-like